MPSTTLNTLLDPLRTRISHWKDTARHQDHASAPIKHPSAPRRAASRQPDATGAPSTDGSDKARARRAQVCRAQIKHRQRKAHHIAQLELDIAQLRDMVAAAEAQAAELRRNNDAIRRILRAAGVLAPGAGLPAPSPHRRGSGSGLMMMMMQRHRPTARQLARMDVRAMSASSPPSAELDGPLPAADDVTVSLGMSPALGLPCLRISREARRAAAAGVGFEMTAHQETRVINFILAMEHGCWAHFRPAGSQHTGGGRSGEEGKQEEGGEEDENSGACYGHHLTASAYLMAGAPESAYLERVAAANANAAAAAAAALGQPGEQQQVLQWTSASGISLARLYGLALSLNQDQAELTPVQAWFELVDRYGLGALFQDGVLETLERELSAAVRCLHFGAVMSRVSFEDIVWRTLDSRFEKSL
ncbi:hypothetical protein ESCO_000854 [Escovopsis weberi]|uniref:BZIP domain-containing protein n=1 Tax=Escovopsis weberi TaxID=150374 RepID=A0A0M8N4H0_ESCWE|nr:hypothetical protein ESCO_000854 [Escovopsis weberi]